MIDSFQARVAAAASALLAGGALWAGGLALRHYRASLSIVNDPSMRELEQVTALFHLALVVILLAHAGTAAYFTRHRLRLNVIVIAAVGTVTGVLIAGAFSRAPILGAPGAVPISLVLCGGLAGYLIRAPWASVYLGAFTGSLIGVVIAGPSRDPMVMLAVIAPQILVALVSTALGRLARRAGPLRRRM